jgi:hypothetical protein
LAEPLPKESAVVDGNGVAIAAELMDEFFHLLAKIGQAGGERATNCHFCGVLRVNFASTSDYKILDIDKKGVTLS